MARRHEDETDDLLTEPQGVNAGGPIDAPLSEAAKVIAPDPVEGPPDTPFRPGSHDDEMAGLPEQKPGYPGQQRSIDTS
ncbi:hypothetical protein [Actinomadura sp. 21ATH]|uniref:hypothetical protein n=1 Tax=Actinomadura sp. 21ATH TaxID=1735444 RepID=UPI0035C0F790